jgi:hypothetical protein
MIIIAEPWIIKPMPQKPGIVPLIFADGLLIKNHQDGGHGGPPHYQISFSGVAVSGRRQFIRAKRKGEKTN